MANEVIGSIRDKIRSGALPLPPEPPTKCFVGKGTNQPCDACDEIITQADIEYELDITESRTLRFHAACYTAWHTARAERMAE
jgi:hypothetical protein